MSFITDMADEVSQKLGVASLSMPVTPSREHMPTADLPTLVALTVTVMPGTIEVEPISRGKDQTVSTITIGVQKQVKTDEEVDDLQTLCLEIADLFKRGSVTISDLGRVPIKSVTIDPIFHREDLEQKNLFTSIVTLEFLDVR